MVEETSLSRPAPPYKRRAPGGGGGVYKGTQTKKETDGALHCDIADVIALEQDDNYVAP